MAGYPVGGDFEIKYYLVQMHYDNPTQMPSRPLHGPKVRWDSLLSFHSDRVDSSGIRFYIGEERRQHDIGYLTLGTESMALGITIPPRADRFIIDSYCPASGTQVSACGAYLSREG